MFLPKHVLMLACVFFGNLDKFGAEERKKSCAVIFFYTPSIFMFQKLSLQNDDWKLLLGAAFHCFMEPEICFDHFVVLALGLHHSFCRGRGFDWSDCSYKHLFQLLHVNWKGDIDMWGINRVLTCHFLRHSGGGEIMPIASGLRGFPEEGAWWRM